MLWVAGKMWVCEDLSRCALLALVHHDKDQSLLPIEHWQSLPWQVRLRGLAKTSAEPSANIYIMLENVYHSFLPMVVYNLKTIPLQRLLLLRWAKPAVLFQWPRLVAGAHASQHGVNGHLGALDAKAFVLQLQRLRRWQMVAVSQIKEAWNPTEKSWQVKC